MLRGTGTLPMKLGIARLSSFTLALLILATALLNSASIHAYAIKSTVYIYIDVDGVVHVNLSYRLSQGLNDVELPTQPIITSINVEVDGRELPIAYNHITNSVVIISEAEATCIVSFIANATINENRLALNLSGKYMYRLILSPNIILLTLPNNITDIGAIGDLYYIDFDEGKDVQLLYIVKPRISETTAPSKPPTANVSLPLQVVIVALGVGTAGVSAFFLLKVIKRRSEEESEVLSELDIAILKSVEKKGGAALQSELQRDLHSVPRTTLWRHVRKLEKLGYVRIEKVGQQNRVVLVKKLR
uniref:Winged helix-turn-helix transcriptional regulator n=1 Tax=Ignisphaera aggregans TaxID=334771 RepID=A0A7C4FFT4_9CREN